MPEVSYIGLAELLARGRRAVEQGTTTSANGLVDRQRAAAPDDTGELESTIHLESIVNKGDTVEAITAASSPHAVWVQEGTHPHEIEPSSKQDLAWAGAEHPDRVVHHPGEHANPFMSGPLLAGIDDYERDMAAAAAEEF